MTDTDDHTTETTTCTEEDGIERMPALVTQMTCHKVLQVSKPEFVRLADEYEDLEHTYKLTVTHGLVSVSREVGPNDWYATALWRSDDEPVITEHVLDWVIAVMAESVDWWAQRGCEGPMPAPPPADLCKEHARLVARRRGISVAHNEHV